MLWGRPTWGVFWVWDARLTSTAMLTSTVTDLDRRVRDVETSMATVRTQLEEIERHALKLGKTPELNPSGRQEMLENIINEYL